MKRGKIVRHLKKNGCQLQREGRSHSLWLNPKNKRRETLPRHTEIPEILVKKICKGLKIPIL